MGFWNRKKRGGSSDSPGIEIFPDSTGTETFPDSADTGTLSHSIGIETKGGIFTPVIGQGMPLPASRTEIFTTAERNQPSIQIRCFQGDEPRTADNMELGLFELTEIPPGGRGEPQIEVTFHVDASGAFSVTARDARTGLDMPVQQC